MELRGADFDWDNWAGLAPDKLAAATAAAAFDGMRPTLAARAMAVLRRRRPNHTKDLEQQPGDKDLSKTLPMCTSGERAPGAALPAANGINGNGSANGHAGNGAAAVALSLPVSVQSGASPEDDDECEDGGDAAPTSRGAPGAAASQGLPPRSGSAAVADGAPRRRLGSGNLDASGGRERGSRRSLGSGNLDATGEQERASRRSLGIGSRRSLDSGARRHDGPTLAAVRLTVPAGQLVGMCGEVRSEKTSCYYGRVFVREAAVANAHRL